MHDCNPNAPVRKLRAVGRASQQQCSLLQPQHTLQPLGYELQPHGSTLQPHCNTL